MDSGCINKQKRLINRGLYNLATVYQSCFLLKHQLSKIARTVERRRLAGHPVPCKVVRLYGLISALIKVCADALSGLCREVGKEGADEGVGDVVGNLPAVLGAGCLRVEGSPTSGVHSRWSMAAGC